MIELTSEVCVPKTDTIPAWQAYNQLLAMCQNLEVVPSAIEAAIERAEHTAKAYQVSTVLGKSKTSHETASELSSVAKYFRWVHQNLKSFRAAKLWGFYGCTIASA